MMNTEVKTYSKLISIPDFYDRIEYLKLNSRVGDITFGGRRAINQILYQSLKWKEIRRKVILRDDGYDLGHISFPIDGKILVHHINPITLDDILKERSCVFDMDNLISASYDTHEIIHYSKVKKNDLSIMDGIAKRRKNDTCPWR